jgi:hypothetical protein
MTLPYRVSLGASRRRLPALLRRFSWWLVTQPYGSVGCFAMEAAPLAEPNALAFGVMPDGQRLFVTVDTEAIWVITRKGRTRKIAASAHEFLSSLAVGDTGVLALDTSNASRRAEFATWLRLSGAPSRRRSRRGASDA